jgi:oligopeptide transport system substrate-binding protein
MKLLFFILVSPLANLALCFTPLIASADDVYRFHLTGEPHTLDPQLTSSASGNYVVHNLYRGLMKYDADKGLQPEGASSCKMEKLRIHCSISEHHLWSDGQKVKAEDYVRSFRRIIDSKNKIPQAEFLFAIKNAKAIWAGKLPPDQLGVTAVGDSNLKIELESADADFLGKLAHPALSPIRALKFPGKEDAATLLSTGPYKMREWKAGNHIVMEPNPYYFGGAKDRPVVEVFFIDDDSTALRLYEAGKLSLLRRLPTANIPEFKDRADFYKIPVGRFDYLGFSPALKDFPKLRKALSESLDYENFKTIFNSVGRPGCPSLPPKMYEGDLCLPYKLAAAQKLFKEQTWPETVRKQYGFSQMGGDDILRGSEWFQGQWKKNLGLTIDLDSEENGVYTKRLASSPPAVFRKGVGLDRPSCLAGVEIFESKSPENYIGLKSQAYDHIVDQLRSEANPAKARRLCSKAIRLLIIENWIIPLGEFRFFMLASPKFTGWKINILNQLDLANLKIAH